MKNLKVFVAASLLGITAMSSLALASHQSYDHGYRHGHHDGHNEGFVEGLLVSTAALFASFVSHEIIHHKELVYIGAADEAAVFLQQGGEPSALLRQAIDTERDFLVQSGHQEAADFNDEVLAEMVIGRVTQLNQ